jgi:pimeloyl-ACP methyl ester carboxylesterase
MHPKMDLKIISAALVLAITAVAHAQPSSNAGRPASKPIMLRDMGSFMFGGTVSRAADGNTFHGDHGYAQYFVPVNARRYPLVMWHGLGQTGKTWESTPDGRDGFWQMFVKRGWPVYIIDQPRRGRAGRTAVHDPNPPTNPTLVGESGAWNTFRFGAWNPPSEATFFPGVQVPQDPKSVEQMMRWQAPNTGAEPFPSPEHRDFLADSVGALLRQIDGGILITHSFSGQYGWATAMRHPELVKAVVAYEPGAFAFPDDEPPPPVATDHPVVRTRLPQLVPRAEFMKLTRMPIQVVFGDNISDTPSPVFGTELWRVVREQAKQFVAAVNRAGGDAQYLELPAVGLRGNTHFIASDLDNREVADLLSKYLQEKRLDQRARR